MGCSVDSKGKPIPITDKNTAWCETVNIKPIPWKEEVKVRYPVSKQWLNLRGVVK